MPTVECSASGRLGATGVSPIREFDAGHVEDEHLDADWRPGDGGQSGKQVIH